MSFKEIYPNATVLTQDFLRNEFGFDLENANDFIVYRNYYIDLISAIDELNAFKPTASEIEEILTNGKTARLYRFECPVKSENERKYLFLMAQARQLKYDKDNGRASMIRGEDKQYNLCEDTRNLLGRLGLIIPVRY